MRQEANPRACRRIHAEGTQQRASGSRWWHSVCDIFGIQHRNVLASNKGFVCFRNCLVPKHHRLADGPAILSDESRHLKFPSSCVARCNGCAAPVPAVCRPCACGVPPLCLRCALGYSDAEPSLLEEKHTPKTTYTSHFCQAGWKRTVQTKK